MSAEDFNHSSHRLPTNVSTSEQLVDIPLEYLSQDKKDEAPPCGGRRPLRYVDDHGDVHNYALRPMWGGGVVLILLVELLERFSYYGVYYTQTPYLTGAYDDEWNAGMDSVGASSLVSASTAVAYTAPFLGAVLADRVLGDYGVVALGASLLYIPGCLLIALTAVPRLMGETFNEGAISVGLLFLYPVGAGTIKSVVNVFGAKQYHPILQSASLQSYYVNFYMCINMGALMGGMLIPVVARRRSVAVAYFIPVGLLALGTLLFVAGTPLYVRSRPHWNDDVDLPSSPPPMASEHRRKRDDASSRRTGDDGLGGCASMQTDDGGSGSSAGRFAAVAAVTALIVPFMIVQQQMTTTFKIQGAVMHPALWGVLDAASVTSVDALSVVVSGYVVGHHVYPALAGRGVRLSTGHKFAIGHMFAVLAMLCSLAVEYRIHAVAASDVGRDDDEDVVASIAMEGETTMISIGWQTFSYALIGTGEIFTVSAAYEAAFAVAPRRRKALASATNLFVVGAVLNFFCLALYGWCEPWFRNGDGNTHLASVRTYSEARVYDYFWVLLSIAVMGTVINLLPPVRDWLASVERQKIGGVSACGAPPADLTPVDLPSVKVCSSQNGDSSRYMDERVHDDRDEQSSLLELDVLHNRVYSTAQ